jgi:hypothetical protein
MRKTVPRTAQEEMNRGSPAAKRRVSTDDLSGPEPSPDLFEQLWTASGDYEQAIEAAALKALEEQAATEAERARMSKGSRKGRNSEEKAEPNGYVVTFNQYGDTMMVYPVRS